VILRHTERTAYRCFLPDLAGFTGFCCTGPDPYLKAFNLIPHGLPWTYAKEFIHGPDTINH
jgi:hypothetical protein